ncbi:MAG: peptide chain release factor aRF-1 [DPANN group archaeon]|nr:peptide chain release factor aRF-1 [DPANN group archaeon]
MFLFSEILVTKKQLKALIRELGSYRGRHTELVSISVPSGYNINEITNLVRQEAGTCANIKSKTTRKNVMTALGRIEQALRDYKVTPTNGLCIYSGNTSEKEGVADIGLWMFEPPEPINLRTYRCEQTFLIDHLKELVEEKEVYGLVTIDKSEASIGFLIGKSIKMLNHFDSMVPGKTGKGGQSAQRFERVRAGLLLNFMKMIGESATKSFETNKYLKGILIGGPGPVKETFADGDFLSEALKKKIIGIKDLSYSGEPGLKELLERSEDVLKDASSTTERNIIIDFFEHLKKEDGLATYGYHAVMNALKMGAVKRLVVSEDLPLRDLEIKCRCGFSEEKVAKKESIPDVCPKCSSQLTISEKSNIFEMLENTAEDMGTEYKEVSSETPEGAQFIQLGGIGAVLRYKH